VIDTLSPPRTRARTLTFLDRTWRSMADIAFDVLLPVLFFVASFTAFAVSIGLLPLFLVGVPLLWATFRMNRLFALITRRRYAGTLGVRIDTPVYPRFSGAWRTLLGDLGSAQAWKEMAYFGFIDFVLGMLAWVIVFGTWSFALAAIASPFFGTVDPAWLWPTLGIAALVAAPFITQGAARVRVDVAQVMLGRGRTEELSARVDDLTVSRAALATATDTERQRIERDLHDGAQQRLVALAMNLGVAKTRLDSDPDSAKEYVTQAHEEAKQALVELRNLARGIHPVVLSDRGLDAALSALAARSPVPVRVDVAVTPRPAPTIEAVAYFVVAEALTNVARHSRAGRADVVVRREGDRLQIRVSDDGIGGADPAKGSGVTGLAGRVRAADGSFWVTSPEGGPTQITVELPCGS